MPEPRCALESLERGEPMLGTATHVDSYLLVEHNGPWPRDAIAGSEMSAQVRDWLSSYFGSVLLIRRPNRPTGPVHVFEARPEALRGVVLDSLEELPGQIPSEWPELSESLWLVCTHGKRDACCAKFGRPVVDALAAVDADATWEVSHIGGHRFAGNVLVLPSGEVYGRVPPDLAPAAVLGQHPELLRGVCWLSPRDQVSQSMGGEAVQTALSSGRLSCRDDEPSPISAWLLPAAD